MYIYTYIHKYTCTYIIYRGRGRDRFHMCVCMCVCVSVLSRLLPLASWMSARVCVWGRERLTRRRGPACIP